MVREDEIMLVNVIGLGYIGLPTALAMASHGVEVVGTDYNNSLVSTLNSGKITFKEKGLEELFCSALKNNIRFTMDYQQADMYVVSVPTPYDAKSKKVNATYVVQAVEEVIKVCKKGSIIVIESTISPGTIDTSVRPILEEAGLKIGEDIHLAHAPERIIPGNMLFELENNSRTIGADTTSVAERVRDVYKRFCKGEIVLTDIRTAEMTKVVENTYRDINIAYANELTKICHSAGLNVYEIIKIANRHPRVNILSPGPGVGGHCISVDPWFLVGDYPGLANIILAARKINDSMPEFVLERIADIMEENYINDISKVGLYGLTYKENVDDVRESPTLQLLDNMRRHLAKGIKVFDPMVTENLVDGQMDNFEEFLKDTELIVIMVAHSHLKENQDKLVDKVIFDTRNTSIQGRKNYKL